MLAAEASGLITIKIELSELGQQKLTSTLERYYNSDYASELAENWNGVRTQVIHTALNKHLLPMAQTWLRNALREEQEAGVGESCLQSLNNVRDPRLNTIAVLATR